MYISSGEAERKYVTYKVTRHLLKQWAKHGLIEYYQTDGGHWKFCENSLKAFLGVKTEEGVL